LIQKRRQKRRKEAKSVLRKEISLVTLSFFEKERTCAKKEKEEKHVKSFRR